MGHKYGDRVLIEVGPRVRTGAPGGRHRWPAWVATSSACCCPTSPARPTRCGWPSGSSASLEKPIEVDGTNLGIEASCGIALAPDDGDTADLLLQRADVAMYVAKDSQHSVVVYTDELNVNTPARLALLGDLRNAVAADEFVLHYQPKAAHDVRGGCWASRRSSAGSTRPSACSIPDQFIPEAERTGLIEPMTVWVLDEALRQCRQWLDAADPAGPRRACRSRSTCPPAACSTPRSPATVAGGPRPLGRARPPARPRDHRDDHHDRPQAGPAGADRAGRHGGDPVHRRLRHRLLVAGLPAGPPGAPAQDRPDVRHGHGERRRRRGHRPLGDRPGPQPRPPDGGRGRRGRRHLGAADRAGMRQRPGLLPGPADGRGAFRAVACQHLAALAAAPIPASMADVASAPT